MHSRPIDFLRSEELAVCLLTSNKNKNDYGLRITTFLIEMWYGQNSLIEEKNNAYFHNLHLFLTSISKDLDPWRCAYCSVVFASRNTQCCLYIVFKLQLS